MVFFTKKNPRKCIVRCATHRQRTPKRQKFFASFFQKRRLFLPLAFLCCAAGPRLFIEDNDFLGPGGSNIQSVLPLITNPDIRVLGFTVVTGDGWCDEETASLLRFLEIAHRTDIPVFKGAVYPLVNTRARLLAWEQAYGVLPWKGAWNAKGSFPEQGAVFHPDDPAFIPADPAGRPGTQPAAGSAVSFLIAQVHRYPHQVTILAAGPMTNLALAIRIDPDFATLAKELVFMGAMLDGNQQQVSVDANLYTDFNFLFDPEAAHIVLTAPWARITALGSVTNETLLSAALVKRIVAVKTPVTAYIGTYSPPLPLWDELAAAVAVDPGLITRAIDAVMDVDIGHGMFYGHAMIWPPAMAPHRGERLVRVVQAVDMARFYDGFIKAAQAPVPR
jgi:inosine-uridine nucleoside N-ribohydrolase